MAAPPLPEPSAGHPLSPLSSTRTTGSAAAGSPIFRAPTRGVGGGGALRQEYDLLTKAHALFPFWAGILPPLLGYSRVWKAGGTAPPTKGGDGRVCGDAPRPPPPAEEKARPQAASTPDALGRRGRVPLSQGLGHDGGGVGGGELRREGRAGMGTDGGLVSGRGARWGGACDQVEGGRLGTPVRGAIQGRRSGPATDKNKRERRKEKKMSQRTTRRNNDLDSLSFACAASHTLASVSRPATMVSVILMDIPLHSAHALRRLRRHPLPEEPHPLRQPTWGRLPPRASPLRRARRRRTAPPGCGGCERPRFTPEAVVVVVVVAAAAAVAGAARRCPTAPQLPAACASRRCHPGKPAWRWRRPPRRYAARKHGRP